MWWKERYYWTNATRTVVFAACWVESKGTGVRAQPYIYPQQLYATLLSKCRKAHLFPFGLWARPVRAHFIRIIHVSFHIENNYSPGDCSSLLNKNLAGKVVLFFAQWLFTPYLKNHKAQYEDEKLFHAHTIFIS